MVQGQMGRIITPSQGLWTPPLSQKQADIYNSYSRYLLVSGPRMSGKTLGCCHKVVRHAFDTDRAMVAVFARTMKQGKDQGVWSDITSIVLPEYLEADIGMKLTVAPKIDGTTRQPYFRIQNRWGTESTITLNSLDVDSNIELIRGKRYSMIFFTELSNFKDRMVFDVSKLQLRCFHLPFEAHQWIADTNPADEGDLSWIYEIFYKERCFEGHEDPDYRDQIGLIEVMIPDNPFLDDARRSEIYAAYRHDPDLYARYVEGKWTRSTKDSHFSDVFRPNFHIIGDTSSMKKDEWEVLLPEEGATELITGSDIGSINHSIQFIDPTPNELGQRVYRVVDEIVLIGKKLGLGDVAEMWMEKMDKWEKFLGKSVIWRHWSDKSAFDAFRPVGDGYDHTFFYKYSDGRINLQAAPKFSGSVQQRVNITRRLLFDERLLMSASCPMTIQMMRSLRKGTTALNFVDRSSEQKHPFDSLSYALISEEPADLMMDRAPRAGRIVLH